MPGLAGCGLNTRIPHGDNAQITFGSAVLTLLDPALPVSRQSVLHIGVDAPRAETL